MDMYRIRVVVPATASTKEIPICYDICDSAEDVRRKYTELAENSDGLLNIRDEFKAHYLRVFIEALDPPSTVWNLVMEDVLFTR